MKRYSAAPLVSLPVPQFPEITLGAAITGRASCRRFALTPLTLTQISGLLNAAYGVRTEPAQAERQLHERPVPSAGGGYPLEVYLFLWNSEGIVAGTYHYEPFQHALEHLGLPPDRSIMPSLFLEQPYLADTGALIILTAVPNRLLNRYGDRGYRYLLMEAGHVAQNVGLMAAAVEAGCLNLGGFQDDVLSALLNLHPDQEVPLYAIALGTRATANRMEGRGLAIS